MVLSWPGLTYPLLARSAFHGFFGLRGSPRKSRGSRARFWTKACGPSLFDGNDQLTEAAKDVVQAASLLLDMESLNSRGQGAKDSIHFEPRQMQANAHMRAGTKRHLTSRAARHIKCVRHRLGVQPLGRCRSHLCVLSGQCCRAYKVVERSSAGRR